MTRRTLTLKWVFYALWSLVFLLGQQLLLPWIRIGCVHPFVLPAMAAITASFEGRREGPVYALVLGLVCDPVAGLVEVPCVKRNVIGAVNAVSVADMALAGVESRIPVDEVIDAMGEVGRRMPVEFRETALGGLAATPTGRAVKKRMHKPQ